MCFKASPWETWKLRKRMLRRAGGVMDFTKEVTVNSRRSLYYSRHDFVQYMKGTTVRAKEFPQEVCNKAGTNTHTIYNHLRQCRFWPRRMQSGIYVHPNPNVITFYEEADVETITVLAQAKDLLGVGKNGAICFRKVVVIS